MAYVKSKWLYLSEVISQKLFVRPLYVKRDNFAINHILYSLILLNKSVRNMQYDRCRQVQLENTPRKLEGVWDEHHKLHGRNFENSSSKFRFE